MTDVPSEAFNPVVLVTFYRVIERATLTLVVVGLTIWFMWFFRGKMQDIKLSSSNDKFPITVNLTIAMPVLLLLVLVGYAWISLAHPFSASNKTSGSIKASHTISTSKNLSPTLTLEDDGSLIDGNLEKGGETEKASAAPDELGSEFGMGVKGEVDVDIETSASGVPSDEPFDPCKDALEEYRPNNC